MTPAIQNTATALRLAARPEGLTARELAELIGMTRQGAHRLLRTLEAAGELVRSPGEPRGRKGTHPHVFRRKQ